MIIIIFYTILLLFIDRTSATELCMQALAQWYETMIPALFPMMLLSSVVVDTGFAAKIGRVCNHTLLRFLKISDHGCYCLITGFLLGFPMGAKTTSDMLSKKSISAKEAEYLLSFINCIGPMYTINLIHTLFAQHELWKLLVAIYGLPLLYGTIVRYTLYRKTSFHSLHSAHVNSDSRCVAKQLPFSHAHKTQTITPQKNLSLPDALYECVPKCGKSILMLGGYMVLFQVSFVTLHHFLLSLNLVTDVFYPLLEITGGFFKLPTDTSLAAIVFYTTFGGGCCLLQTYSFLKPAGISVQKYILHKTILACIACICGVLMQYI